MAITGPPKGVSGLIISGVYQAIVKAAVSTVEKPVTGGAGSTTGPLSIYGQAFTIYGQAVTIYGV